MFNTALKSRLRIILRIYLELPKHCLKMGVRIVLRCALYSSRYGTYYYSKPWLLAVCDSTSGGEGVELNGFKEDHGLSCQRSS